MWLNAPNITCTHGFSTRLGGVSSIPFDSLNLGGSQDDSEKIKENRKIALEKINLSSTQLFTLKQVHGNDVCFPQSQPQEGDALVTDKKNTTLAISIADCYPVLFYDEVNHIIGAAHAGWRGTQAKIVETTLKAMIQLGAKTENIQVAIGQGISQDKFEVGAEVIEKFREAGFPEKCWSGNKIDLIACNLFTLFQNNIPKKNVWTMNRCTFENDFFSYRQDKGVTGRMWAVISMT
ncbi:peptidoglycan editing factor PgeF [Aurantibacillus circumpalustris]|uniref:peptidoglycan editing factor PgeF n=1 Tax=Aurantibacillus circumpalustris TaxID=3036359 RepID=UPI00295AE5ED|nr:peptidoglycan editing factor PgeF [Aurantibacillus circumpalustris]